MRRLLAATILGAGMCGTALADDVALVIGNGSYRNAPEAETAVRDAKSVATALEDAGWKVTIGVDLDRDGMKSALADFAAGLDEADSVVIFYSGHALRTGGVTYLAPVDASAGTLTDVLFDGVPLELVERLAAEKSGQAILFIDGAQLRGFKPTAFVEPGLAALDMPEGVMVVSAAAPGRAVRRSRWRDSRFARVIVDEFLQPGAPVHEVAEKIGPPIYVAGQIHDDFMLVDPPKPADDPSSLDAEVEITFWRAAENSGRREDYEAYLRRYPDGFFVDLARARLRIKDDGTREEEVPEIDPWVEAENALNLSRIRKRQVQELLLALGHDPNGIDGIFGRGTRNALRDWQDKNGYEATGYLTGDQLQRLRSDGGRALEQARAEAERKRRQAEAEEKAYWNQTGARGDAAGLRAYLERYPSGLFSKAARDALERMADAESDALSRRERRAWRRAQRQDTAEAYRDYLGEYPNGIFRDRALVRLDEIEGAERRHAESRRYAQIENGLGLSQRDRISVEQRLRLLGYEVGPQDGNFDNRTRSAIEGYQKSRGINATGYLNRPTIVRLVRDTNRNREGVTIDGADVIRGVLEALTR